MDGEVLQFMGSKSQTRLKRLNTRTCDHPTKGSLPPTLRRCAKWINDIGQLLLNLTPRASNCICKTEKPCHFNLKEALQLLKDQGQVHIKSFSYLPSETNGLFQILVYSLIAFPEWPPKVLCKNNLQCAGPHTEERIM